MAAQAHMYSKIFVTNQGYKQRKPTYANRAQQASSGRAPSCQAYPSTRSTLSWKCKITTQRGASGVCMCGFFSGIPKIVCDIKLMIKALKGLAGEGSKRQPSEVANVC